MPKAPKVVIPKNLKDMPPVVDPPFISELLQIGYETILKMLRDGTIKGDKTGRHWRISREAVIAYVNGLSKQKNTCRPVLVRRVRRKKTAG